MDVQELHVDIKELNSLMWSIKEEMIKTEERQNCRLKILEQAVSKIGSQIEAPKRARSAIVNRVIVSLLVALTLGLYGWMLEYAKSQPSTVQLVQSLK